MKPMLLAAGLLLGSLAGCAPGRYHGPLDGPDVCSYDSTPFTFPSGGSSDGRSCRCPSLSSQSPSTRSMSTTYIRH